MTSKVIFIVVLIAIICGFSVFNTQNGGNNMVLAKGKDTKSLVVYFSRTGQQYSVGNITEGNTAIIGKMIAKENDCYAFDVRNVEAKLVIENGEFVGNVTAVYVHSGELEVNGGQFDILQKSDYNDSRYLLNCLDKTLELAYTDYYI